jgi:hypothetical protein
VSGFGRPPTPNVAPAAPVVTSRPTNLTPNGILLSNGAVVAAPSTTVSVVLPPPTTEHVLGVVQIPLPFSIEPVFASVTRDMPERFRQSSTSLGDAPARLDRAQAQLEPSLRNPLSVPSTPVDLGPEGDASSQNPPPDLVLDSQGVPVPGSSVQSVIRSLGNPTMVIYQDGGQILQFNSGIRVLVRNGVVVAQ